jgi:hypothetical protein
VMRSPDRCFDREKNRTIGPCSQGPNVLKWLLREAWCFAEGELKCQTTT